MTARRERCFAGIRHPAPTRLPEGEPLSDRVGRVSSCVIAEPAGKRDASSPGKYERDLAHRWSPLLVTVNLAREHPDSLSPAKRTCREDDARPMPCRAGSAKRATFVVWTSTATFWAARGGQEWSSIPGESPSPISTPSSLTLLT